MTRRLAVWVLGLSLLGIVGVSKAVAQFNGLFWPTETAPRPLPAREVRFPPYELRTLSNGMRVIAVLHHEQPVVSIRLLVRAGGVNDGPGKAGVAQLLAGLLDQGTTSRTAEQIADQIDFIGGELRTGAGSDLSFVDTTVMKDSFTFGMDLTADLVRNPAFAEEEIERQKQQTLSALQVNVNDPEFVADAVFDRLVFGFHPYGLPNSGTPETLGSVTREDLVAFHSQFFVPNNMVLGIVGDVTGAEAFAEAERAFGKWPTAEVPALTIIEPPPPTRRIVIIDKPDAVQTEIRAGHLTIPRNHPDYTAADLALRILGGEGANRLHRVLRSERGLTYGAMADLEARKQTGDFIASTDTRTDTTGEALRLMVEEIAKLRRDRVSRGELADAQAYLTGSFPLTIETPNQIAAQVLNVVFFELPIEQIGTLRDRVQAVTPDDVQRVAQELLKPDRLSIVLVGNANAFVQQLRAVGFTEFEVIPIDQLDLMSAALRVDSPSGPTRQPRDGAPPPVRPTTVAYLQQQGVQPRQVSAQGADIVRRVITARGGLAALKGVRTVTASAQTTFRTDDGTVPSTTKTYVAFPDKFRVDATIAGAEVSQVFSGGRAWIRDPRGVRDAPVPMREDFAASVRREIIPLLIAAAEGTLVVRLLPDETRSGSAYTVLEISGPDLSPVRLFVDAQSAIARQAFRVRGPDGREVEVEEVFSDYRTVSNLRIPFRAELYRDGQPVLERTLTSVSVNDSIDESLFTRPR
jgi:zinc protease